MKSNSDTRPPVLHDLGDGSWYYNYNIVEGTKMIEGKERTSFDYYTVHFEGKPDYDSLVKIVIGEYFTPSEEVALINKYIASTMKVSNPEDKKQYENYINRVAELKAMVKNDLQAFGIMEPDQPLTLEQEIAQKLSEIDAYDNSDEVNSFLFNGQKTWIDAGTRAIFRNSIESAELLQEQTIQMPLAGAILTVPVEQAKIMLAKIQRYADNAAITTIQHKSAIAALASISKVHNYNFKKGYPVKENFTVNS